MTCSRPVPGNGGKTGTGRREKQKTEAGNRRRKKKKEGGGSEISSIRSCPSLITFTGSPFIQRVAAAATERMEWSSMKFFFIYYIFFMVTLLKINMSSIEFCF